MCPRNNAMRFLWRNVWSWCISTTMWNYARKNFEKSRELTDPVGLYWLAMSQYLPHGECLASLPAIISTQALLTHQNLLVLQQVLLQTTKRIQTAKAERCFSRHTYAMILGKSWFGWNEENSRECVFESVRPVVNEVIKWDNDIMFLVHVKVRAIHLLLSRLRITY